MEEREKRNLGSVRPAVLGGPTSLGEHVTNTPDASAICELPSGVRLSFGGQLPFGQMLVDNRLPFEMGGTGWIGRGDTRLYCGDGGWGLSKEVIRLWLAAELELSLDSGMGPDDDFICLPAEFFDRATVVAQLERALLKLERWRSDPEFLAWVESLGAMGRPAKQTPVSARPAVLDGEPIVSAVDAAPSASSPSWRVAMVPSGVAAVATRIGDFVRGLRRPFHQQQPLMLMLERHPWMPFQMAPALRGSLGDARLYYTNAWDLPIEAVRLWLAAELRTKVVEDRDLVDRFIRLPASFFDRPTAIEQLRLALVKLERWRTDHDFLTWVDGLGA